MVTAMQGLLLYLYEQDTYPYYNSADTTAGMSNLKHFYLLCIESWNSKELIHQQLDVARYRWIGVGRNWAGRLLAAGEQLRGRPTVLPVGVWR